MLFSDFITVALNRLKSIILVYAIFQYLRYFRITFDVITRVIFWKLRRGWNDTRSNRDSSKGTIFAVVELIDDV